MPGRPSVADESTHLVAQSRAIADALLAAERPLIVSGVEAGDESVIQAAANIAAALHARGQSCALMLNVPECNSLGLALMANGQAKFEAALAKPAALVIVLENELYRRAESTAIDAMLASARLVVLDHSASETSHRADLVLPAATFAETGGTLVSSEGRAQRYYQPIFPEDDVREAWRWIADTGRAAGSNACQGWKTEDDIVAALAGASPVLRRTPERGTI